MLYTPPRAPHGATSGATPFAAPHSSDSGKLPVRPRVGDFKSSSTPRDTTDCCCAILTHGGIFAPFRRDPAGSPTQPVITRARTNEKSAARVAFAAILLIPNSIPQNSLQV